jgi:hypothetical protein
MRCAAVPHSHRQIRFVTSVPKVGTPHVRLLWLYSPVMYVARDGEHTDRTTRYCVNQVPASRMSALNDGPPCGVPLGRRPSRRKPGLTSRYFSSSVRIMMTFGRIVTAATSGRRS